MGSTMPPRDHEDHLEDKDEDEEQDDRDDEPPFVRQPGED